MTLSELLEQVPELHDYIKNMPEELKSRCYVKVYPPGAIIHQKDYELKVFGIVAKGEHRVINEFQNGNIYMIEKNEPIDFIGEVTILAEKPRTSVTIETLTETTVLYFQRSDFEKWISKDIHLLRLVARKVALKLYRSSYNRGARLFYPPQFILLDYIIKYASSKEIKTTGSVTIKKTRQELYEESGITVKTINRTIKKLEEDGLIKVIHGKIWMDLEMYKKAQNHLYHYVKN